MPIKFNLAPFAKKSKIFIETGTYLGDGVQKALDAGFQKVYSIELDSKRFTDCSRRFRGNPKVVLFKGDSGKVLGEILKTIHEPVVFWIDAHFCADGAEIGEKWAPIKEEIKAIASHGIKTHTILVDDYRCMNNTHVDKRTKKEVGFPGKDNLLKSLKEINPNYKIEFLDGEVKGDVVVASVS